MIKLLKIILAAANLFIGLGMTGAALAGCLDAEVHPQLVIAGMSFPIWVPLAAICLIADFFALRKWCIWMAVCFAVSLPMVLTVWPVNPKVGAAAGTRKDSCWTLLSYNVSNFVDLTGEYVGDVNPAVQYVLQTDADVTVLSEGYWLTPVRQFHLYQSQIDSVYERYEYVIRGRDITLLSKFPADTLSLSNFPDQLYDGSLVYSKIGGFLVDIHGRKTAVIGMHLKSLGLTRDDKNLYEEFTRGEGLTSKMELTEAKKDLIGKIATANSQRAKHIRALIENLRGLDIEDIVICGDFNDTPGCFALRQLEKEGFREVYPLVGNGYMYTFNSDRLLFQIDHVLFRGNLRPIMMHRGNLRTSDHYPLLTVFTVRR